MDKNEGNLPKKTNKKKTTRKRPLLLCQISDEQIIEVLLYLKNDYAVKGLYRNPWLFNGLARVLDCIKELTQVSCTYLIV